MGDNPELSGWALNTITSVLIRGRQRAIQYGRGGGDVTTEAETGVSSHRPRKAGSHQKLEEARNRFSPRASRGSGTLTTT